MTIFMFIAVFSLLTTSLSYHPLEAYALTTIDFEAPTFTDGATAEGPGAIHPDLDIQSPVSYDTEIVRIGAAGFPGTAYNTNGNINNGCLTGQQGMGPSNFFGYPNLAAAEERVELDFSFINGKTVSSFSIETYDYGDFNPWPTGASMTLVMTAYDAGNAVVDTDVFSIASKLPKYDGCDTDGIQTLVVSGTGISRVEIRATNGPDPGVGFDNLSFELEPVPPQEIDTSIDVKPTSCPNPLNVKSKGVLPVAILGSDELDVTDIDVSTILLNGIVSPIRSEIEDVATPFGGVLEDELSCTTDGADGFDDLTLKFDKQAIIAAIGAVNDGDVVTLTLTGELLDGTALSGQDNIRIVAKGK